MNSGSSVETGRLNEQVLWEETSSRSRRKKTIGFCHFCGGPLPFDSSRVGELVNCPACLMESTLDAPDANGICRLKVFGIETRILNWEANPETGARITGHLCNATGHDLDWARVDFVLYDAKGVPLGLATDHMRDLGEQIAWEFTAPVPWPTAVRASFPVITTEHGRVPHLNFLGNFSTNLPEKFRFSATDAAIALEFLRREARDRLLNSENGLEAELEIGDPEASFIAAV